jgi:hypothetical protein
MILAQGQESWECAITGLSESRDPRKLEEAIETP